MSRVGRDAPYSLAELAQYVDLATPAMKRAPLGIGRNVEIFDRLRRRAYSAIVDWKIGKHDWGCPAGGVRETLRLKPA